jgi:hypothetical protein
MLDTNKIQLIKRLKSKPRLGADPFDAVTDSLKKVFDTYKTQGGEVIRLNVFGILAGEVQDLNNKLNVLEKLNSEVQSSFNKNVKAAAEFGVQLDLVAKNAKVNATKFKQYAGELRSVFTGQTKFYKDNTKFSQQIAKQSDIIRNQLGVSEEAYKNFVKYQGTALGRAKDVNELEENFKGVNAQLGDVAESVAGFYEGSLTDMIEGLGGLSQTTLATFGRLPKELGLAVLKTKSLGIELEKVTGIGKGFLDIEQSIANEIEFQILSGEELLTQDGKSLANEFQKAALAQDANRSADLLVGFIEKYGEKLKDNVFLQEQAAQMLGLSTDDLFGAINQYNTAGAINKDIFKTQITDIKDLGQTFEQVAKIEDKRANETILSDDATKSYINTLGDYTGKVESLQTATKNLNTELLGDADEIGAAAAGNQIVGGVYAGVQTYNDSGAVLDAAQKGTADNSAIQSNNVPTKQDVFIPAGGANNIISGPKGSFSLDPSDDIIAMPDARKALANKGGGDASALIAALQGMSFHVTNVFDGDKIQSQLTIRQGQRLNA